NHDIFLQKRPRQPQETCRMQLIRQAEFIQTYRHKQFKSARFIKAGCIFTSTKILDKTTVILSNISDFFESKRLRTRINKGILRL
ncbi:hypothetical protein, partial [uncultured Fibrobacter sp.]|uniref:hypothetical protein n=1 Tax=uncultured Fibrobacter sp. TaxID=261512 RepID=UPI0025D632E7